MCVTWTSRGSFFAVSGGFAQPTVSARPSHLGRGAHTRRSFSWQPWRVHAGLDSMRSPALPHISSPKGIC